MNDPLRAKLNLVLATAVAFAGGLFLAAEFDLAPSGMAAVQDATLTMGASPEQIAQLEDLSFRQGFAPVVDQISGAVVTIRVEKEAPERFRNLRDELPFPFRQPDEDRGERQPFLVPGSGSGFIIDEAGYIVTNNHVVEGAKTITVVLPDRREIDDVTVVGRDPQTDVALLKIDAPDLTSVPLGRSEQLDVGEWVLAIGSPGFEAGGTILESTVTAGIVSAKGRSIGILGQRLQQQNLPNLAIEDFIQTDAVINQGNSGGPLVNVRGEVVGMSTAIISETGNYQGYGFAVPTELIRQVVDDLMQYGEVRRAVLGIQIEEVQPADARYFGLDEVRGVEIADFSPLAGGESPARQAGLERGDIILEVDGQPVQSVPDLQSKVRAYDPGESVTLTVARREGDRTVRREIDVELGAAESGEERRQRRAAAEEIEDPLGVEVQSVTPEIRSRLDLPDGVEGVLVTDASRRSPLVRAAGALSRFTLISEIDGEPVQGIDGYRNLVSGLEPGGVARVQLYFANPEGQGAFRYVTVEIPSG